MSDGIALDVRHVHHAYTPTVRVLHDVDLRIGRGQIVSLVGPSGCGKSTLLNIVLGTLRPSGGHAVTWRHTGEGLEENVVRRPGRDRGVVYQRYALFPFLTALENVAIGPILDETSFLDRVVRPWTWWRVRDKHRVTARAMLERVGLGAALHKYPSELSGGMRQRVAIAQALVMKPEVLLLDEPFGALDEATREALQEMLLGFYEDNLTAKAAGEEPPHTILIVTHELNEAIYVGDRVIGLSQHWDWQGAGLERSPGATIVYDKPAPVYRAGEKKSWGAFVDQREEIRAVVFEPEEPVVPGPHVVFWDKVATGDVGGVLAP